jgi:hypothetical protein
MGIIKLIGGPFIFDMKAHNWVVFVTEVTEIDS